MNWYAGSSFFAVTPAPTGRDGKPVPPARLLTARPCLGGRLWTTRFHMESLRSGHRVEAVGEPRYWDALRPHAENQIERRTALTISADGGQLHIQRGQNQMVFRQHGITRVKLQGIDRPRGGIGQQIVQRGRERLGVADH